MEAIRAFFRLTLLPLVRLLYRLRTIGAERVPATGGVLLIANHVSYLDSFIIYAACPRPVRFVIVSRYLRVGAIRWFLNLFGAIPITPGKSRDAIRLTAECLRRGDVVCIFPEGQLTRTGQLNELKKGFELIARQGEATVVPLYLHGLWGSIFSAERCRYFWKWPHRLPWPVVVAFGEGRPAGEADVAWAGGALRACGAAAFAAMPDLERSLPAAVIRSLKRDPFALLFAEHGKSVRRLKRHQALSTALALASRWREEPELLGDEPRIGLLLPAGSAPALLNLALILAGRVPVNLPFPGASSGGALDLSAAAGAIRRAGLGTVITSRAFVGALSDPEWTGDEVRFLDLGATLAGAGLGRLLAERLRVFWEPAGWTLRRIGLPKKMQGDSIWATIDTAGVLREYDDRTILAEALRLTSGGWIEAGEAFFTEAGLSDFSDALWAFWLPVLHRHAAVGRSWGGRSDAAAIEAVCSDEGVRRLILPAAELEALAALEEPWHPAVRATLRSVLSPVVTPDDQTLLDRRSDRVSSLVGAPLCAYLAIADGGGIVAVSQPDADPVPLPPGYTSQPGRKLGSPGRLLPGLTAADWTLDEDGFVGWR
ncbi:MAG: 1-acyl-sn-glycerol-3-phosphate acyltransferase [Verrucomicrobiales bacterium]|nr:1-acyl-sn-glycerol-3-phosphate acyltransferase [Verrucomicrobiales bacterium]